ncbi:ABC transporter ATP-binding protein [Priestia megaterium]|nr:ABC transporter ATP-binding protein [Priestia megaterium]
MTNPIISVQHLSKSFNKQEILSNVSFDVQEGSINGLLGPNGSGKTTIIRLLNGVISPSQGKMELLGFNPITHGEEIRAHSGIVTESTNLYHEMSAWDNLMFYSKLYNVQDKERAKSLLTMLDMYQHKDKKVGTFSTGMKKRVSLAKALLNRPKLLFLDEPTNGLDPEGIQLVLHYLKELNEQEGITILICSHVLHQLENVCTSYLFIKNGVMLESGTREELEMKYIKEVQVLIETSVPFDVASSLGYTCEEKTEGQLVFTLPSRGVIPNLLRELLNKGPVYGSRITNHTLDNLYFQIGGAVHE